MRKPAPAATSLAWFIAIGGTFGCLLPCLLDRWHFHQPLPQWSIAEAVGSLLICAGMNPLADSFIGFFKAGGTPVPIASPPRPLVSGFYRYLRNPSTGVHGCLARAGAAVRLVRPGGVHRSGMVDRGGGSALLRTANPGPEGRGRIPGIPARGPSLGTAPAPVDSRTAMTGTRATGITVRPPQPDRPDMRDLVRAPRPSRSRACHMDSRARRSSARRFALSARPIDDSVRSDISSSYAKRCTSIAADLPVAAAS
jgi:hypothetical protein